MSGGELPTAGDILEHFRKCFDLATPHCRPCTKFSFTKA